MLLYRLQFHEKKNNAFVHLEVKDYTEMEEFRLIHSLLLNESA